MNWARFKYIAESRELTLIGYLNVDVLNTPRLVPPHTEVKIHVERATPEFALVRPKKTSTETYRIRWLKAGMSVTRVRVNDYVASSISRGLNGGREMYFPFTRTETRLFEIPRGSRNFTAHTVFSGSLPDRIVLALTETESVGYGEYANNPMLFSSRKFDLSLVQLYIDDMRVLPTPLTPDWSRHHYATEYMTLLQNIGADRDMRLGGGCIEFDQLAGDYGVFCLGVRGVDGRETGSLSVELGFSKGTPRQICGFIMGEFRSCMILNKDGEVRQTDY